MFDSPKKSNLKNKPEIMRIPKNTILILLTLLITSFNNSFATQKGEVATNQKQPVALADPFIMLHENTYYAYGTNDKDGIAVYTSDDLVNWQKQSALALHKDDSWGDRWFWAPEVYYIPQEKKFYMYYSVDEHISVATSDSPAGPFRQDIQKPIIEDEKCIDNSLFIDDDGKAYLSFVRFTDGNNIWVAEMESDLKTMKKETMKPCIHVTEAWENELGRVTEGSFIVKHKGIYYMIYSANDYQSPNYGVGYATASSPMEAWVKYDKNPVFQKPDDLVGVGHSAIFKDKEGKLRMVFHAHHDKENIHPRLMYITDVSFSDDEKPIMNIGGNIIATQQVK